MNKNTSLRGVEAIGRLLELLGGEAVARNGQAAWSESTFVPPRIFAAVTAGATRSSIDEMFFFEKIKSLKRGKSGTATSFSATPGISGLGASSRSSSFS